jgi:hypothetical protein
MFIRICSTPDNYKLARGRKEKENPEPTDSKAWESFRKGQILLSFVSKGVRNFQGFSGRVHFFEHQPTGDLNLTEL